MAYPWEQRPEEPDEAYEAYIADYTSNGHLLVDTDDIRKRLTGEKSDWAATWEWDQRSTEWDAEADRRRHIKFARMQNVAANDLVVMASARLLMLDPDSVEPEALTQLRYTVQIGSELFESSSQTLSAGVPRATTQPEKKPPKRTTKRSQSKTKQAPSGQAPPESKAPEIIAPDVVTDAPQEPEPPAVPPEQPVVEKPSLAEPAPLAPLTPLTPLAEPAPLPPPDPSTELPKDKPPTIGPRCGKWGGLTDHRKRGEEPCDECRGYSTARQKAATTAPQHPGSPTAPVVGAVSPVILRPLETEPI